jgi:hypothetical protein
VLRTPTFLAHESDLPAAGLRDGIFLYQKYQFGYIFEGLGMGNVCTYTYFLAILNILQPFSLLYGHLVYFMAVWYILWPFGTFYGLLVYFMAIWYILWRFGIFMAI